MAGNSALTGYYANLSEGNPDTGRLNYKAFVDTYVETNGNRELAMQAAGYKGENYAENARAILAKSDVKRAIAEKAADQFFTKMPLGLKVLDDLLSLDHHTEAYSKEGVPLGKRLNVGLLKLKVTAAMKMFELAQVKELASASLVLQATRKKTDLNELAERLSQLAASGIVSIPGTDFEIAGTGGLGDAGGFDGDGGEAEEDNLDSGLQAVPEAERTA